MLRRTVSSFNFPTKLPVSPNPIVTHEVLNQVPFLQEYNSYLSLPRLVECVKTYGIEDTYGEQFKKFGADCGSAYWLNEAQLANKTEPQFAPFDKQGRRVDQVQFVESYHRLMQLFLQTGVAAVPADG
ncbi:Adaptive response protein AidB N-terminal domain containing protein, putative [Angomonas deanei]|uniref:Adaptive response protein AidB N-terminal domain containing protein, putative n=1 Tax=Angomonas deanei TaxID=59799 RepID=A0A7G2CN90_9TRYP|nr:Adaptive response protein AidB N-terminal domain containing protein, putative [Angomonas deanei]